MSGRWWRVYANARHAPSLLRLSAKSFRKKFYAAMEGEVNEFTPFIRLDRGRPGGTEWERLRALVFKRDDYTCMYCGERGQRLECDHIHPVARGGSEELTNLATACFACNRSKRDKTLEEWRAA